jgi:D-alanine-D-alanine ligase
MPIPPRARSLLREKQEVNERVLKRLLDTNTYVRNVEGVNAVGEYLSQRLRNLGFKERIFPHVEVGSDIFLTNTDSEELDFIIYSHIDVSVPFKEQVPYRVTEHKIYGTGVWTNKGGLTALLAAISVLKTMRKLRNVRLGIFLSSDDTIYGKISQRSIRSLGVRSRYVLGISGSKPGGSIILSRSGASLYKIEMKLKSAASTSDVSKSNVIFNNLLSQLIGLSSEEDGIALAIRSMDLRSSISSLYSQGEATISLRYEKLEQAERLDEKIKRLVRKRSSFGTHIAVEGGTRRSPMLSSSNSELAFSRLKEIANELGLRVYREHRWSSSNISSFNDALILDGLGPVGMAPQNDDEFIFRHSLIDRSLLLAMILLRM